MHMRTSKRTFLSLVLILITALVGSASAWAQGGGPKGFTATPLSPDNQITSSLPKGRRSQANA